MKTTQIVLLMIPMVVPAMGQSSVALRLVHKHSDAMAQRTESGRVAEAPGYDMIVSTNSGSTNLYWMAKRRIVSEDDITNVTWRTDPLGCTARLLLSRDGRQRLAWVTHNANERAGVFVGGSLRGIITLGPATQLALTNILTESEARGLKKQIKEKAEQGAAPLPSASAEPSEGAR